MQIQCLVKTNKVARKVSTSWNVAALLLLSWAFECDDRGCFRGAVPVLRTVIYYDSYRRPEGWSTS